MNDQRSSFVPAMEEGNYCLLTLSRGVGFAITASGGVNTIEKLSAVD